MDDEDYDKISKMTGWYVSNSNSANSRTLYVTHDTFGRLHRFILGITDSKTIIDHIDRNGLNNQKSNLRLVTNSLNKRNQDVCSNNRFNFNGISYEPAKGNHSAQIRAVWSEYDYIDSKKRNKVKSKSFSLSRYGLNEAIRLAILTRIEKMKKFDYIIDDRSETIERIIKDNPNVDMGKVLNINLSDFI